MRGNPSKTTSYNARDMVSRHAARIFPFAAILITATCWAVLRSRVFALNPDMAAWGVTFDLTLTIPLVYYVAVIRTGRARPITIAPVFVVCVAVAARLIPHEQQ